MSPGDDVNVHSTQEQATHEAARKKRATVDFITQGYMQWLVVLTAALLMYPWVYELLSSSICKHGGTVNLWTLRCNCPVVYNDNADCSTCQVNPARGTCGYNSAARYGYGAICNNRWTGVMCDDCNAQCINPVDGVCSNCTGDCNYAQNWYENSQTGQCTVTCRSETRCSGHGTCTQPYGSCVCDEGYSTSAALSGEYGAECNAECPNQCVRDGVKRGDCVNAACRCFDGFAGPGCQTICPVGPNGKPCSGRGSCTNQGLCQCNRQHGTLQQLYVGSQCQFTCPIERGVVCNDPDAKCTEAGGEAQCACPAVDGRPQALQPRVCNCNCHGRGQCSKDGCVCNAGFDPSTDCTACLPNYMSKQTNCSQYCNPDITCMGRGLCKTLGPGNIICAGDGCKNFDRRVTNHLQPILKSPIIVVAGTSGSVTIDDTLGKSVYFMQASELGTELWTNYTVRAGIIDFSTTDTFNLVTPIYNLLQPQELQSYQARTMPSGACTLHPDGLNVSCTRCKGCAGFIESSESVTFLACAKLGVHREAPCGASGTDLYNIHNAKSSNVWIRQNTAKLQTGANYRVQIERSTPKGCSRCLPNYYPSVEYANAHNMTPCSVFCNSKKCAHFGTCNDAGECVCNTTYTYTVPYSGEVVTGTNLNAAANCAKCNEKWYPAPSELAHAAYFFNKTIGPCTVFCDHNVPNNSTCPPNDDPVRGMEAMPGGCNYCSGNGYCTSVGLCDCSDPNTRLPTGFLPPYCDTSCNSKKHRPVCNGHGECFVNRVGQDGNCACSDGWFGEGCQFGPTRDEQQFWYKNDTGHVKSKPCNGGTATLTSHYQITLNGHHTYELSNQSCTTKIAQQQERNNTEMDAGFHCCFGDAYNHVTTKTKNDMFEHWGCAEAMERAGVFCDTHAINNIAEGVVTYSGTCKSVVCDCNTVPGHPESQLGGPGCQLSGCGISTFLTSIGAEDQTHSSVCGRFPPEGAQDSCIRGECLPVNAEQNGMSRDTPVGTNERSSPGYCGCNAAPDRSSGICGSTAIGPSWVYDCCGQNEQDFSGIGCGKYCVCKNIVGGTCATSAVSPTGTTGTTCFCRRNQDGQRLFCGDTCSVQCGGTIAKSKSSITNQEVITQGIVITGPEPYCPIISAAEASQKPDLGNPTGNADRVSPTPTPADQILPQDPRCFSNLFPCNGNGECADPATGSCYSTDGMCMCHGAFVPIGGPKSVVPNSVFTSNPLLFTGENCMYRCPQTNKQFTTDAPDVFEFFITNREILEIPPSNDVTRAQERTAKLRQYYDLYRSQICNGHGYCSGESGVNIPKCTCYGDYGGDSCEEKCSIAQIDVQSLVPPITYSQADILYISDRFRLQPCGARKRCATQSNGGVACETVPNSVLWDPSSTSFPFATWSGNTNMLVQTDWVPLYLGLNDDGGDIGLIRSRFPMSYSEAEAMVRQFPMVFASHQAGNLNAIVEECFSNYASEYAAGLVGQEWGGYYTGELGSLDANGLEDHSDFLPVAVRWQMNRTCDSWCYPMSSHVVQPPHAPPQAKGYDGVRCCRRCVSDWDAVDSNPYGGCIECPNYAIGRSCTKCSRGFDPTIVHFNAKGSKPGNCTSEAQFHEGACALCQGSNRVYPEVAPPVGGESEKSTFPHCLPCLGDEDGNSGSGTEVCGGLSRGKCIGAPETFASRQLGGTSIVKSGNLLDENTYNFTQCQCTEGWTGVTCSVPNDNAACGLGTLHGKHCNCKMNDNYYSGPYCSDNAPPPKAGDPAPPQAQYIGDKWVACNGRGQIQGDACVCDGPYDGATMCLEYTQQHSDQRRADVCMCDLQGQGVPAGQAELTCQSNLRGQIVAMVDIIFRECQDAFPFITLP